MATVYGQSQANNPSYIKPWVPPTPKSSSSSSSGGSVGGMPAWQAAGYTSEQAWLASLPAGTKPQATGTGGVVSVASEPWRAAGYSSAQAWRSTMPVGSVTTQSDGVTTGFQVAQDNKTLFQKQLEAKQAAVQQAVPSTLSDVQKAALLQQAQEADKAYASQSLGIAAGALTPSMIEQYTSKPSSYYQQTVKGIQTFESTGQLDVPTWGGTIRASSRAQPASYVSPENLSAFANTGTMVTTNEGDYVKTDAGWARITGETAQGYTYDVSTLRSGKGAPTEFAATVSAGDTFKYKPTLVQPPSLNTMKEVVATGPQTKSVQALPAVKTSLATGKAESYAPTAEKFTTQSLGMTTTSLTWKPDAEGVVVPFLNGKPYSSLTATQKAFVDNEVNKYKGSAQYKSEAESVRTEVGGRLGSTGIFASADPEKGWEWRGYENWSEKALKGSEKVREAYTPEQKIIKTVIAQSPTEQFATSVLESVEKQKQVTTERASGLATLGMSGETKSLVEKSGLPGIYGFVGEQAYNVASAPTKLLASGVQLTGRGLIVPTVVGVDIGTRLSGVQAPSLTKTLVSGYVGEAEKYAGERQLSRDVVPSGLKSFVMATPLAPFATVKQRDVEYATTFGREQVAPMFGFTPQGFDIGQPLILAGGAAVGLAGLKTGAKTTTPVKAPAASALDFARTTVNVAKTPEEIVSEGKVPTPSKPGIVRVPEISRALQQPLTALTSDVKAVGANIKNFVKPLVETRGVAKATVATASPEGYYLDVSKPFVAKTVEGFQTATKPLSQYVNKLKTGAVISIFNMKMNTLEFLDVTKKQGIDVAITKNLENRFPALKSFSEGQRTVVEKLRVEPQVSDYEKRSTVLYPVDPNFRSALQWDTYKTSRSKSFQNVKPETNVGVPPSPTADIPTIRFATTPQPGLTTKVLSAYNDFVSQFSKKTQINPNTVELTKPFSRPPEFVFEPDISTKGGATVTSNLARPESATYTLADGRVAKFTLTSGKLNVNLADAVTESKRTRTPIEVTGSVTSEVTIDGKTTKFSSPISSDVTPISIPKDIPIAQYVEKTIDVTTGKPAYEPRSPSQVIPKGNYALINTAVPLPDGTILYKKQLVSINVKEAPRYYDLGAVQTAKGSIPVEKQKIMTPQGLRYEGPAYVTVPAIAEFSTPFGTVGKSVLTEVSNAPKISPIKISTVSEALGLNLQEFAQNLQRPALLSEGTNLYEASSKAGVSRPRIPPSTSSQTVGGGMTKTGQQVQATQAVSIYPLLNVEALETLGKAKVLEAGRTTKLLETGTTKTLPSTTPTGQGMSAFMAGAVQARTQAPARQVSSSTFQSLSSPTLAGFSSFGQTETVSGTTTSFKQSSGVGGPEILKLPGVFQPTIVQGPTIVERLGEQSGKPSAPQIVSTIPRSDLGLSLKSFSETGITSKISEGELQTPIQGVEEQPGQVEKTSDETRTAELVKTIPDQMYRTQQETLQRTVTSYPLTPPLYPGGTVPLYSPPFPFKLPRLGTPGEPQRGPKVGAVSEGYGGGSRSGLASLRAVQRAQFKTGEPQVTSPSFVKRPELKLSSLSETPTLEELEGFTAKEPSKKQRMIAGLSGGFKGLGLLKQSKSKLGSK